MKILVIGDSIGLPRFAKDTGEVELYYEDTSFTMRPERKEELKNVLFVQKQLPDFGICCQKLDYILALAQQVKNVV